NESTSLPDASGAVVDVTSVAVDATRALSDAGTGADRVAPTQVADASADGSVVDSSSSIDGSDAAGVCSAASPDRCATSCVDLRTDIHNCGQCGHSCAVLPNQPACNAGMCDVRTCGTLGTQEACSSCFDKGCTAANTILTCDVGTSC